MTQVLLRKGSHRSPRTPDEPPAEICFNEGIAWVAGESWTYTPRCVDYTVRTIGLTLNDRWPDDLRQQLVPFMLRAIGTADDGRQQERIDLARTWLIRETLPMWLEVAGRVETAKKLREMPDSLVAENASRIIQDVREECWQARTDAMGRLKEKIRAKLAERGATVAVADAAADADADAVAVAVADAVAVAATVADADAVAATVADAVAVAVAVAVAATVAVAVAAGEDTYWGTYDRVYAAVKAKATEIVEAKFGPTRDERAKSVLELLDRMLPLEGAITPEMMDRARLLGIVGPSESGVAA